MDEAQTGCAQALLTHSCTAALDLAALRCGHRKAATRLLCVINFRVDRERFCSARRGSVFVTYAKNTLNMGRKVSRPPITPRTRAIVPVPLRGVRRDGCHYCVPRRHDSGLSEDEAEGNHGRGGGGEGRCGR